MFGKTKDNDQAPKSDSEGQKSGTDVAAPPLKPFSKKGSHGTSKGAGSQFRPEIPRRVVEIPGAPRRGEPLLAADDDANRLTVGRNICLSGEITSCERLIVEGRVEATISEARLIEVSATGNFKGSAEVDEADISGHFEGNLIARHKLTIRKTGHVNGSVRYGRIVIESGGEIAGDMASLDEVPNDYSPIPEKPVRSTPDIPGSSD